MGQQSPLNIRSLVASQADAYGCPLAELRALWRQYQDVATNFASVGDRANARNWQAAADDMAERIADRARRQAPMPASLRDLMPRDMDDLLDRRMQAVAMADRASDHGMTAQEVRQDRFAARLSVHIERRAQA